MINCACGENFGVGGGGDGGVNGVGGISGVLGVGDGVNGHSDVG